MAVWPCWPSWDSLHSMLLQVCFFAIVPRLCSIVLTICKRVTAPPPQHKSDWPLQQRGSTDVSYSVRPKLFRGMIMWQLCSWQLPVIAVVLH